MCLAHHHEEDATVVDSIYQYVAFEQYQKRQTKTDRKERTKIQPNGKKRWENIGYVSHR